MAQLAFEIVVQHLPNRFLQENVGFDSFRILFHFISNNKMKNN